MVFDKIYIISYIYNLDKRQKISKYLKEELGINNFEFIYGIDPNISNIKDINIYDRNIMSSPYILYENKNKDEYYLHTISCGLAHLTAFQHAYINSYNKILIIEDDVDFILNNEKILTYFNNIPNDADLIHYGYIEHFDNSPQNPNELYHKIDSHLIVAGTQCYAICNYQALEKIVNGYKQVLYTADQFWEHILLNRYIVLNKICKDQKYK